MTQSIEQIININVTENGLTAAVSNLERLESAMKGVRQSTRPVTGAIRSFGMKAVNSVNSATQATSKLDAAATKAAASMSKLKSLSGVSGFGMKSVGEISSASSVTSGIGNIGAGTAAVAASSGKYKALSAAADKARASMAKLGASLKTVGATTKKTTTNVFRLRAALALVIGAVFLFGNTVKKWFELASDYAEATHLLYSTLASSMQDVADSEKNVTLYGKDLFGNVTDESIQVTQGVADVVDSLDTMADKMMLDPTQLNRTFSSFYEMANAAGVASDKIGKLSLNTTRLSYDLASLWDVPFEDAAKALRSALSGVTTSVKKYGIDVSRTAADQWLLSNGFDATYNSLNRANKMIVIYNMLAEHTTTAQGDLARSALQPANMLRILGQQATLAARQLGGAIFPVFTKLIPIAIMLAQAIQRVAAALSAFLGGVLGSWYTDAQKQWSSYMKNLGSASSGVDELADELEDTEDSAGGAGSALEEMTDFTLPFDELHKMNEELDSAGSGGGGGDGIDLDIPIADMTPWDESLKETMLNAAQETIDAIANAIDNTFGEGTFDALTKAWDRCALAIKLSLQTLIEAFASLGQAFINMFDWPAFLEGFASGFHDVLETAAAVVYNLAQAFSAILENERVVTFFENASYSIGEFIGKISGIAIVVAGASAAIGLFGALLTPLKMLFAPLIGLIQGAIGAFGSLLGVLAGASAPILGVAAIIAILIASFVACYTSSQEFRDKVTEAFEKVGEVIGVVLLALQPAFDMLKDAFSRLKESLLALQPLWENLLTILPVVAAVIGGVIVVVVTVLSAVIDFIAWVIETVFQAIGAINDFFGNFGENMAQLWENIKTGVGNWVNSVAETLGNARQWFVDKFNAIKDGVITIASNIKEGITEKFNGIKDKVGSIFNNIKTAITTPIEAAKNTLSNIIDKIKSIFNIKIEFPHFTLPHISWRTTTLPFFNIAIPTGFNVEWYAKGGVFDAPTIAGIGEAGPEAVVPLSGARMRPFAEAVASELKVAGNGLSGASFDSNDDLVIAMSTAVYEAMIKGFPDEIKTDVYLDATKVNNSLDNNKRQRGFGSSLVKAGA